MVWSSPPEALGGDGDASSLFAASSQDFLPLIRCFFPPQLLPEKETDYSEFPQLHRVWGCLWPPHSGAPTLGLRAGSPALSCEEPWGRIPPGFGILHGRNPRSWGAALPALGRGLPVPGMGVQGGLTLRGGGTVRVGQGVQLLWDTLLQVGVGRGTGPRGLVAWPRVRGSSQSDYPSFPLLTA